MALGAVAVQTGRRRGVVVCRQGVDLAYLLVEGGQGAGDVRGE